MIQQTAKTTVIVLLVLAVGSFVASQPVVEGAELLEWTVDDLVRLAAFGVAAMLVLNLGLQLGDQQERPVLGSAGLSSLVMLLLSALAVFLLYRGVEAVLRPQWIDTLDLVFALAMVGFAGAVLWRLYADFEEIVETVKQRKAARRQDRAPATEADAPGDKGEARTRPTPSRGPGGESSGYCTNCGQGYQPGQRFCGNCGESLAGPDS